MAWSKAKMAVGLGVLLVAGAGTVGVKDTLFAREPSYQGKRLSQWLVEVNYGQPDEARARAGEAIRKMGAKTLPILLDYYRDPVATHRRLGYVDPLAADDRLRQVTWAFKALGPIAIPAIPRLTHLLERHPGYVPGALAGVGPAALPELFDALTNRSWSFWVRDNTAPYLCNAIYSDTMTPEQLRGVLPIALANLSDTNANPMYRNNTRRHAADLLRALQLEPEVCVPALIQGMADTNVYVVEACAEALGSFGKHAESARPLIEQAAGSTNAQLRATAQRVLERLDQAR